MARARVNQPSGPVLRFRGAPPGLHALAAADLFPDDAAPTTVALALGRAEHLVPLDVTGIGAGASRLRISLPQTTAPGAYEGRTKSGGIDYPVVVEVEPWPSLQFSPASVMLLASSGAEEQAHVTVLNDGNVAFEIPGATAFGLFTEEGVELAFAAAFREDEAAKGEQRFDRFVEGVAEQHGGFVRVRVSEGAGILGPGELRTLGLAFRFPDGLESGRVYGGSLTIQGRTLAVRATVAPASAPTTRARRKAG